MTLANRLTFIRIALIIPFIIFLQQDSVVFRIVAFFIFLFASITDYYDGKLARQKKEVTLMGKFLDPLADKLFVSAALIILVHIDEIPVPVWAVILIIAREFIINGLRTLAAAEGRIIEASIAGKVKTIFQMVAILILILILIIQKFVPFAYYLVVFTAIISVYSGILYLIQNKEILKENHR